MTRPMSIDPAVAELVKDDNRRGRLRRMSPGRREKIRKDMSRNKATYDLPPEIIEAIDAIARKEECSVSSVAALLLAHGLQFLALGGIKFEKDGKTLKRDSRSIRFKYTLEIDDEIMEKIRRYTAEIMEEIRRYTATLA